MGRIRQFDADKAIDRATRLFWKKGYSRASLRDLLKAMGIGEGSFYYTFGSKQRLYLECLKHYQRLVYGRRMEALLSEPTIQQGLRSFFKRVLDDLDDPKTPNCCLMAGSLSAEVLQAKELQRYVVGEMRALEQGLVELLRSAQTRGELPAEFNTTVSAEIIVTFLQGFFRVVRTLKNRREMEQQVETLLTGIGL